MSDLNTIFADEKLSLYGPNKPDPLWFKNKQKPEFYAEEAGTEHEEQIILLHGLLGAMSNWDSAYPLFAKYAHTYNFKFPLLTGHRSEITIGALAMYTELFVREHMKPPVVLCGNSMGGHVALRMALASPELVKGLVLAGPSGLYEHTVDALPVRPGKDYIRHHMGRVYVNQKFVTEEAIEEMYDILKSKVNVLKLITAARSAKKDNMLNLLKQISVPTLLLWGSGDLITTMDVADLFHKNIPNSKLVVREGCGHAPMIEQPEWFADEVQKFVAELNKKS